MAIFSPDHLFEQAERLIAPPPAGPPRQVDIRRAISAAYYAVFSHICSRAADHLIGRSRRNDPLYGLVHRAVDHRGLKRLCEDLHKSNPPPAYTAFVPQSGLGRDFSDFALALIGLQEDRHEADYDPMVRLQASDALVAIDSGRAAIKAFNGLPAETRRTFLTLLLFPPRRA